MNEEAIKDAYALFKSDGYGDSIEDFKLLISQNEEALKDAYTLFKGDGYGDTIEDFQSLMGVKKKVTSEPVGDTEGTMASTTEQAPASPISSDSQPSRFSDPIDDGASFRSPTVQEDIAYDEASVNRDAQIDTESLIKPKDAAIDTEEQPSRFSKPVEDGASFRSLTAQEESEVDKASINKENLYHLKEDAPSPYLLTPRSAFDSRDLIPETDTPDALIDGRLSRYSADAMFEPYFSALDEAIESGLVKNEKEFNEKFPDMSLFNQEATRGRNSFMRGYDNLSDEIKEKIEPAIIKEDGVIIGVNPDLISKENLKFLEETALDDDMMGESSEGQAQLVIKAIVPQQKIDYLINEKKLLNLGDDLIATREEITRLITIGLPEQARDLRDNYFNPNLEDYKSLASNLNDKSVLINSLDIVKDNTGMWAPVSTLSSAVETLGSSIIMALPALASSAMHLSSNLPGSPGVPSAVSSEIEKSMMGFAMDLKKDWEEAVPTDNDDTIGNFIGNTTGQVAFIVGSAALGGMPAAAAAGYTMSMSEMYQEGIGSGLSHDDAMFLGMTYGAISAPLEMLGAGSLIKKATGVSVRKKIIESVLKNGVEGFTKEIAEKAVKASFKPIIIETLKEGAEEGLQEGTQFLLSKGLAESYNEYMREEGDAEFQKTKMFDGEGYTGITKEFWKELGMNVVLGAAGGSIGGVSISVMQGNVFVGSNYKFMEKMLLDPKQMAKINDQLTAYRRNGTIKTDEELQVMKERVGIIQEAVAQVDRATKANPKSFGIEQQKKTFALVAEKLSAEKEIEGMMPILVEDKKSQIEEIDNKIRDIASGKITEAQIIAERTTAPVDKETAPVAEKKKSKFIFSPKNESSLSPVEKETVESGGIFPDKEYGFLVVPKELESSNPTSKNKNETFFTGDQLIQSGFSENAQKAFDERNATVVEEAQETTTEETTIFRGEEPRKDVNGEPKTVHKIKKGKFGSAKIEGTDGNKGTKPIKKFTIPAGTTVETVKLPGNTPAATSRVELETEAIDNSTAQVVKLETIDAGGRETQYIIKDNSLLESGVDMTAEEEALARGADTVVEEVDEDLDNQVNELESLLKDPKVDFRLKSDNSSTSNIDEQDAAEVTVKLNLSESPMAEVSVEANETEKSDPIDVEELNERTDTPFESVDMGVTKGLPHLFTISDQLRTGNTKNSLTGNLIDRLKGAVGFNGTKGNETSAWANVKKELAEKQHKNAVKLYLDNKESFDNWWASKEGKKYDGLVPMAVVQMGESSIASNEATFRVLADNMTKIPEQNKIEALSLLKKNIKEKAAKLKKNTKEFKEITKIIDVLDTYDTKSLGDIVSEKFVKELGSLPVRARFISLVTTGSPTSAKSDPIKVTTGGLRGVAKVLGKGVDPRLVHLQEIVNEITDPQLKNVPIGNIVSLVGIDVKSKNQGAKKVNHPNYDWGVEGKSIGVLSNPAPMESVFPKAYNKIFKDFFVAQKDKKKKGKTVDLSTARNMARRDQLGVGIGIPSKDYRGAYSDTSVSEINKLVSFLNIAFPNVEINTGIEQFNNIIASEGVKVYLKGDDIIYGVTVNGDVYINPEVHNSESQLFNTAIHEMGHVWTDYLQTTKKGKEIYAQGIELVKSTDEYKKQLDIFNGDVNKAANEALAILIGNKGETIADGSINSKFKDWLIGMWDYIKGQFKMSSELSSEEIQNLTLDDVLGTALADIFAGKEIKLTDAQLKKMNNPSAAFSKSDSMLTIIQKGRNYGYRDAVIKVVLQDRGFKATAINKALVVDVEIEVLLPLEFGNVVGGVQDGYKLFTSVREKLRKFSKGKTFIEIREKGLSLLKEESIFQAQEKSIQNELLIGFDKSLGIKRGVEINREMSAIKNNLRQMKVGKKELKGAQAKLKNIIRTFIPKGSYNKSQVNKLVRIVEQTTIKNYDAQVERVIEVVDYQREKAKKSLIIEMVSFIKKNSKSTTTKGGLKRSTGMSARGTSFFKSAKKIIDNSLNENYEQLDIDKRKIDEELVEKAIVKGLNDETLTTKEQAALDEAFAYDMFSGINDMSLEQVKDIFDNLKGERDNFRADFKNRRLIKAESTKEIKREAREQISKGFKIMYNEDGSIKSNDQLSKQHKEIWENLSKLNIWSGIKKWVSLYDFNKSTGFTKYMRENIDHLGTLTNLLDRSGKFFTNNIYNALNKMYDNHWAGFFKQRTIMDDMANSIDGIEGGYKELVSNFNPENITLKSILSEGKNPTDYTIDTDEAMRIYALSKNDTQREKLLGMGFTDKKIDEIKSHIGFEAIAFTDMVVDYLSNEYYESVNDIFKFVNNTDLGYQENYFPTKTDSKKVDAKSLSKEDAFKKNFDAETADALKERNDLKGDIILQGQRFTEILENHFETMERYKAYAIGVQKLVAVFESRDVDTLLRQTGLNDAIKNSVNAMVNPDSIVKQNPNAIDKLLGRFTRYALNFKVIQIAKQATSFVNAFEDYSFRGPGKQNILIDLPAFIIEYAATIATLPSQYKKFENISATFKKRMVDGLKGDILGLESGGKEFKPLSKKTTKGAKFLRGYQKAGAFGTVAGDALGVMGYMVNYNRNIANGMNKEEALNLLNDYNATQQSRRGTEKSGIQLSQSTSSRVFTMFGSTLFLQINKVRSSTVNITRSMMNGKIPTAKDTRSLALNFAIANALFAFVSNIAKFLTGNDEDKEAALRAVKDAAMGLNLLYQIPLIGSSVEKAMNAARGSRMPVSDVLNPFDKLFREIQKAQDQKKVFIALKPIVELAMGAKIDPVIGLYNIFGGDFEDGMYDLLGISKSYKPGYGRKKESFAPSSKPSMTDLKDFAPDLYYELKQIDDDIKDLEVDID